MEFFNSPKEMTLRRDVPRHTPKQSDYRWCAMCGQKKEGAGSNGKVWRGQRTTIYCLIFSVQLCARARSKLRKSC